MNHDQTDRLTRFLLPRAGVRGVHVHLGESWRRIRSHNPLGAAATELLAEATAASALLTGHVKVDGRLSIQLRSQGPLRTLFAECTAAGTLRSIARVADDGRELSRDLRELGDDALIAVTIENPAQGDREPMRYQGLVPIESDALESALEGYFERSEQLPTRILLATGEDATAGLMLQKLPGDEGDSDGWDRAGHLFGTATEAELLALPADTLLHRLFHEEDVEILGQQPLSFHCSCSRQRVADMLTSLGPEEAHASVIDGQVEVICEFCGQRYTFAPDHIDALFTGTGLQSLAPDRVQ